MTSAEVSVLARPAATALPRRRIRWGEQVVHGVLFVAAAISVLTTVGIVLSLLLARARVLRRGQPGGLLHRNDLGAAVPRCALRRPSARRRHAHDLVLVVARRVPARGRCRHLPERVRGPKATAFLKPILEILAAIPTVVLGYFALTFVTPFLRDQVGVQVEIFNALSASLVLGIMLIPTIATLSEDAMAAVPRDLRDGGYALGADKLQVSTRIVVPAAISGIIAAFVLGFSRAVGETMIVLIAAGSSRRSPSIRARRSRRSPPSSARPATATCRRARSSTRRSSRSGSRSS